ncbi:iron-sulfur cluster biosynthesis family protein [Schinkia azotoformans]|uniref:iron-sulfur cluster biosynthesis family protein n=1 Tax=Schinkia azotoformans TaxID=1454 RepID=UPI002DC03CD7|nr:iron-sulfur cluster biosynthesis family protein [Schinkia azotoformans]MEC1742012.1 iron-sulfur cluster biosynthesis family protein [Schinkia azotoformans]MEC1766346.1 iron-sulfur cluster biosynthesis family protein [Schinkia azotoformans]MEC1786475.1 iron-sulfur cluster biosynthesis family protein [Schinkia azotoformans]MED4416257.1 iron-sulfur cluster biosynthesis family protein [Schinkia azotoformans]
MLSITDAAKTELQKRLNESETKKFIRLQLRFSCWVKLKLTLEESIQPNDEEIIIDGLHFIIDKTQLHYFSNNQIDYLPDQTGFKGFVSEEAV